MSDHDHPQTFIECAKHLTKLLITGKLDDAWREDPECVEACCWTVNIGIANWRLAQLNHQPLIGAAAEPTMEQVECCFELAAAAGVAIPNESVEAGVDWMTILLPILLRILERWANRSD